MYILLTPTSPPDVQIMGVFLTVRSAESHMVSMVRRWKTIHVFPWLPSADKAVGGRDWPVRYGKKEKEVRIKPNTHISMRIRRFDVKDLEVAHVTGDFRYGIKPSAVYVFAAIINKDGAFRFNLDYLLDF